MSSDARYTNTDIYSFTSFCSKKVHGIEGYKITDTRAGTLIVATIYLQLIQNRYMF